ncbi:MAG: hypothetical protein AAGG55_08555 [Pseudomonadota bacterium]
MSEILGARINRLAFWSAIIMLVVGMASMVLPLDAPLDTLAADRAQWLNENRGAIVLGWINQMIAMITLTLVLAALAWRVRRGSPLTALLGAITLFASFMAFVIPKFIAIWSVPLLAQEAVSGSGNSPLASSLLELLHITLPYSLFTSFDYLGFWLYAVFGLLIAGPLFKGSLACKVAALSLGAYGVAYHLVFAGIAMGRVAASDVEGYALTSSALLIIAALASIPLFRNSVVATPAAPVSTAG